MPRLPIMQPGDERIEEDGSFDSHFTESARSLLASVDAYVASHGSCSAKEETPSPFKAAEKLPQKTRLD